MGKVWGYLIVLVGFAWMVACMLGWAPPEGVRNAAIGLALVVAGSAYAMSAFVLDR